jgi:hypothetical protein
VHVEHDVEVVGPGLVDGVADALELVLVDGAAGRLEA